MTEESNPTDQTPAPKRKRILPKLVPVIIVLAVLAFIFQPWRSTVPELFDPAMTLTKASALALESDKLVVAITTYRW